MKESPSVSERIEQLCNTIQEQLAQDPQHALTNSEEALALTHQQEVAPRLHIRARVCRAGARRFCGDLDGSLEDYTTALVLAQQQGLEDLQASCFLGQGIVHRNQATYRTALECFHKGLELARRSHARRTESTLLNGLANVYSVLGSHSEAVGYYLQALELTRTEADTRAELVILGNLGFLSEELGDLQQALAYYGQALALCDTLQDHYFRTSILSNRASTLRQLGRLEEALEGGEAACTLARESKNLMGLAPALQVVASIHNDLKHHELAESLLREVLNLYESVGNVRHLPEALRLFGDVVSRQGRHEAACQAYLQALERAQHTDDPKETAAAHCALADHFAKQGAFQDALSHFKAHVALEQRLQREHVQLVLSSRLAEVEHQKAVKDAELQRLRNGELAEAIASLEKANQEKETLLQQLSQQAIEDPLTGLYNRRYLDDYLPRECLLAQRHQRPLALALADLDNFKFINDTFSHQTGDQVLKIVASLFQSICRKSDVIVRYGGEEILLVMPDTGLPQAQEVCERVRRAVEDYPWAKIHPELQVTLSMGVSDAINRSGRLLLRRADRLLYVAKNAGKNRIAA